MTAPYLPPDEQKKAARKATTVRLETEEHADILFIVKLWNDYDKARGIKRNRKWKPSGVMERLVRTGIEGFWRDVAGQGAARPEGDNREKLARLLVAQAEKDAKKPGNNKK